jgi:hypothetical protein
MIVVNKTITLNEFIQKIKEEADDHFCGLDYFKNISDDCIRLR